MQRSKNIVTLPTSLEQKLHSYAVAASAAGVALFACAVPANARIICGQPSLLLQGNETFPVNPAKQQYAPFNLAQTWTYYQACNATACWTTLWNRAFFTPNTAGASDLLASNSFPAALSPGAEIGPNGRFGKGRSYGLLFTYGNVGSGTVNHHKGNFVFGTNGYLGYKFSIAGKDHFGWARLEPELNQKKTTTKLPTFGYETVPGKALRAGACDDLGQLSESRVAPHDSREAAVDRDKLGNSVVPLAIPFARPKYASLGMLALGSR